MINQGRKYIKENNIDIIQIILWMLLIFTVLGLHISFEAYNFKSPDYYPLTLKTTDYYTNGGKFYKYPFKEKEIQEISQNYRGSLYPLLFCNSTKTYFVNDCMISSKNCPGQFHLKTVSELNTEYNMYSNFYFYATFNKTNVYSATDILPNDAGTATCFVKVLIVLAFTIANITIFSICLNQLYKENDFPIEKN